MEVPIKLDGAFVCFSAPDSCARRMLFREREVKQDAGVPVSGVPAGVCVSENRSGRSRMDGALVGSYMGSEEV
jgi:hypothetical protein